MRFFRDLEGSLGRGRIFTYCGILLAVEIGVFAMFIAGTHGLIVPLSGATSTDFVSFYAAGTLADAGEPELAYDRGTHYLAEQRATAPGVEYRFFYYPPVFLLLCAALARLPYLLAFLLFEAATLVFYLIVARRILGERGRPVLAGVLFGALCYKPHFGLLVPVALLAGRHWRASAAAFTSAAVLCGSSLILLGWQTWH